jgi:cytochrome c oxidase cbb3-type subunit 3
MRNCFNKLLLASVIILMPALGIAQTQQAASNTGSFNTIVISLVTLIAVLLIAILILGNTLKDLGFVFRDKMRKEKSSGIVKSIVLLMVFGLSTVTANAEYVNKDTGYMVWPKGINGLSPTDFYILMVVILLELIVIVSLTVSIRKVVRLISGQTQTETEASNVKVPTVNFWDRFNKVVPIEKEHDILLDHNYDGIQELDNSLPPWWKYGFYLTIVTGVIYLWYFHAGGNGPSSYDEYVAEVQAGEESKAAYLAKSANNVDENTVKLLDATAIASGKVIFESTCAACHAKDGGGGVGPNLTDEYWLHGGSIKDVFKSIKYGWADKGMKSWKDDFSPNQIAQLTSYITTLKGTKPLAPKDKQGELYNEGNSAPVDSLATAEKTAQKL